ncbi:MAG: ferritin [Bacilli bacterium]|nr:ferritin [Bacilli bacterium]MBN2696767.1 ferritin [Bacilli bacterium]
MINENVAKMLNEQINKELFSAYLYLDIANYYVKQGLDGFANWFGVQAKEELDHAMIFTKYLQNNDFEVVLDAIENPTRTYKDLRQPLEEALKHEQFVTASIHAIYSEAVENKDYRTQEFLHWFIKEQGEEEKNATDLLVKYDLAEKNILIIDRDLKSRQYSPADYDFD